MRITGKAFLPSNVVFCVFDILLEDDTLILFVVEKSTWAVEATGVTALGLLALVVAGTRQEN